MTVHPLVKALRYEHEVHVAPRIPAVLSGKAKRERTHIGVLTLAVDIKTIVELFGADGNDHSLAMELQEAGEKYLSSIDTGDLTTIVRIVPYTPGFSIKWQDYEEILGRIKALEEAKYTLAIEKSKG